MITVLLPTHRRPEMLREALRSVAAQTARGEIATVVVSENSEDRRSAQVAAEFPELPVQYVQRLPPLPPIEHGRALYTPRWPTEFVAILHDDDWWRPAHVEQALRALRPEPAAAGYLAAAFAVHGPVSRLACDTNLFAWMGAGFPPFERQWRLGRAETLLACLLGTPSHYSSMVVRSTASLAAAAVLAQDNPFDTDRLLTVALSAEGALLFEPLPTVCVRSHPSQDVRSFHAQRVQAHMGATGAFILDLAAAEQIDLGGMLAARLAACPAPEKEELLHACAEPWCRSLLAERGLTPDLLVEYLRTHQPPPRTLKDPVKQLIPPVLLTISRKFRPPPPAAPSG